MQNPAAPFPCHRLPALCIASPRLCAPAPATALLEQPNHPPASTNHHFWVTNLGERLLFGLFSSPQHGADKIAARPAGSLWFSFFFFNFNYLFGDSVRLGEFPQQRLRVSNMKGLLLCHVVPPRARERRRRGGEFLLKATIARHSVNFGAL